MNPRFGDAPESGRTGPPARSLVLFDACSLQNFSVVGALPILEARFGGRAGWTEGVRYEIRRGLPAEAKLQDVLNLENTWLGPAHRLDQPGDDEAVDLIRRGLGGTRSTPLQHLGEAESIRLLERTAATDRVFVTDDGPAADFARHRPSRIRVLDAAEVLAEAHAFGEIGCPAAYNVVKAMWHYPREVRLPSHHREVC